MTNEEILAMEAGREMDALIATEIFGLKVHQHSDFWRVTKPHKSLRLQSRLQPYSTNILAAWQVVEKMVEDSYSFDIRYHHAYGRWFALLTRKWYPLDTPGKTAPEAICKSALLAKCAESVSKV